MDLAEAAAKLNEKYGIKKPETVEIKTDNRTKPNKRENAFMVDLMILRNSLVAKAPAVRERLQKVNKYGWRDLRLLLSLVLRLQDQLMETMPASRQNYYSVLRKNGRYHLDVEGPIRQGNIVLITDTHLATLCESVMESECLMCLKTGVEVEKCPIRQILLEVSPPSEILEYRCEYADAAGALVRGEEVRV